MKCTRRALVVFNSRSFVVTLRTGVRVVDEEKRARARESEIEQNVQILLTNAVLLKCGVLFCEWKHTTIWKYGKSFKETNFKNNEIFGSLFVHTHSNSLKYSLNLKLCLLREVYRLDLVQNAVYFAWRSKPKKETLPANLCFVCVTKRGFHIIFFFD